MARISSIFPKRTNSHYNMSESPACLIASVSGRSLAQAAHRAGWRPNVIDLFADIDTQAACERTFAALWDDGGFSAESLSEAAAKLDPSEVMPVIYGGGFECRPERLHDLCGPRPLIGNPPGLVAALQSPMEFAFLLAKLEIPYPETTLAPPEGANDANQWLLKRVGGSGGGHVRPVSQGVRKTETHYYQRYLPGRSMSAMVLCNGERSQIVGYSEQWRDDTIPSRPFQYGGAVSVCPQSISPAIRDELEQAGSALVGETGLRGLNTFDLIVNNGDWWLLEINPRPGFTFELHERTDFESGDSLFAWHVKTAYGEAPDYTGDRQTEFKAHAVVYTPNKIQIPSDWQWPEWVTDIPTAESIIDRGSPVCTAHASDRTAQQAKETVLDRHTLIKNTISDWVLK